LVLFILWRIAGYGIYFLPVCTLFAVTAFGYRFTTALNQLRGLPDFYVSHDPRAAKMDQFMVRNSAQFGMQAQAFSRLVHSVFAVIGILLLIAAVWINIA